MRPKIVRTDCDVQIAERSLGTLRELGEVITCPDDQEATIEAAARDADILLTCYAPITNRIIENAVRLKGIVKYGVGTDSIDLDAASRRGIYVANCPDYGSETVAEHAFALMIALARRLPAIAARMTRDGWIWPTAEVLGGDLHQKTLGIVGLGRIGRAMARRAIGFGMRVIASDPYVDVDAFGVAGVQSVNLDQLLNEADFVSLHCVLTPETKGLISEQALRRMKQSAILINVSRGALIDEQALFVALRDGWIAGGGFDVFTNEPLALDFPLAGMENVILTPHLAWYTAEAFDRLDRDTVDAVQSILAGSVPKYLKNREALERYFPKTSALNAKDQY